MKHQERKASLQMRHWLMSNRDDAKSMISCAIEMKDTRGKDRFYLRELKQEQIDFGKSVKYSPKGVLIRTENVKGLPDYIFIKNQPSYVMIKYPQGMALVDPETLEMCKKKSLNWEEVQEYAIKIIE